MEAIWETEEAILGSMITLAEMVAWYAYIRIALKRKDAVMEAQDILNKVSLGCWTSSLMEAIGLSPV
jgi:hypothetical protein